MREKVKEMNRHTKFRVRKGRTETEEVVKNAALVNPNQASYAICTGGTERPNTYQLVYKFPNNPNILHEVRSSLECF
jgi:hypothetical protein